MATVVSVATAVVVAAAVVIIVAVKKLEKNRWKSFKGWWTAIEKETKKDERVRVGTQCGKSGVTNKVLGK